MIEACVKYNMMVFKEPNLVLHFIRKNKIIFKNNLLYMKCVFFIKHFCLMFIQLMKVNKL